MYELIIKNGTVIDGTGKRGFVSDIAIENGKIAAIGVNLTGALKVIDATGLTVTPGFIDSHSHSDRTFLTFPDQKEKIEQGITFSITGQCGGSPAPIRVENDTKIETMGEYLSKAQKTAQGSGAAVLIGHNSIRKAVMKTEKREPTPDELEQMKALLEEGLKNGAIGMSLGLYYVPGCYANTDEVVALGKVVAKYGGIITSHIRNENDGLIEATKEFIDIIKATGCRAVFSHHKAMDKNNWGSVKTTLAMIDKANEEGADIYADVYPYIASSTSMSSRFVPTQFHPPMTTNVLSLLDDPDICARIKEWGHNKWGNDLSWVQMVVCGNHPEYSGLNVNQIAEMKGQTDRFDTVLDILREGKGLANICTFMMCEEDVEYVMKHPRVMMCTDSAVRVNDLPIHPRVLGTFPRILGRYVRERKLKELHEMIYKMTSLPARVYELSTKGRIAEGFDADICIFNAETIIDHADFVDSSLANEGLEYVLVDGKVVLENGKYNNTRVAKIYLKGEQ